jgi:hypothetical protein
MRFKWFYLTTSIASSIIGCGAALSDGKIIEYGPSIVDIKKEDRYTTFEIKWSEFGPAINPNDPDSSCNRIGRSFYTKAESGGNIRRTCVSPTTGDILKVFRDDRITMDLNYMQLITSSLVELSEVQINDSYEDSTSIPGTQRMYLKFISTNAIIATRVDAFSSINRPSELKHFLSVANTFGFLEGSDYFP